MQELLKYPFLSSARKALEGQQSKIGFEEIDLAVARAADSIKLGAGRVGEEGFERAIVAASPRQAVEIFATARLLSCMLDSEYYLTAFARGEAKAAKALLSKEPKEEFERIFSDFFPTLKTSPAAGSQFHEISLIDFLSCGQDLAQKNLGKGRVILSDWEALSLFEKAVYSKLRRRLPTSGAPALFKEALPELRQLLPAQAFRKEYSGKYLSLPCIEWILKGVPEGKRYYASMALAVACRNDGLDKQQAAKIMQEFVDKCGKSAHPFTIREAAATLDWVYRRNPRFSCKFHREHGLGPEGPGFPCYAVIRGKKK